MTKNPVDDFEQRSALLDEWVQTRREIAQLEAKASSLLAERMQMFHHDAREFGIHRDTIYRSMVAEYSAAGRLSKGSIEHAFGDADVVNEYYPAVQAAFADGVITVQHVREIVRAGAIIREAVHNGKLDAETHSLYEAAVLVVAEQDTPARTRAHARQVAATLAEATLRERHASAAAERAVTLRPLDDGLALLTAVVPEALGVAIVDRLTRMTTQVVRTRSEADAAVRSRRASTTSAAGDSASGDECAASETAPDMIPDWMLDEQHTSVDAETYPYVSWDLDRPLSDDENAAVRANDDRTFDQIRTDLFVDMLLAADPSEACGTGVDNIKAHIQVTVAASTLAGLDDKLAELDGHGPIHPDVARDLAARSGAWTRLFLDSSGMVVETDSYSPTDSMRRFLRARDQHCRFPGCRVPATRCDIDHNHDHARGGATCNDNLTHLCRGHHTLKHPQLRDEDRWTAHLAPDGSVAWRSPLGRDYRDAPTRRVMFV